MTTNWKYICQVEDIPRQGARRVARPQGLEVAVFRTADDEVFALLDRCPHKGGPLSQGTVYGKSVACPLHNWTIGLCNGQAAAPVGGAVPDLRSRRGACTSRRTSGPRAEIRRPIPPQSRKACS